MTRARPHRACRAALACLPGRARRSGRVAIRADAGYFAGAVARALTTEKPSGEMGQWIKDLAADVLLTCLPVPLLGAAVRLLAEAVASERRRSGCGSEERDGPWLDGERPGRMTLSCELWKITSGSQGKFLPVELDGPAGEAGG